MPFNLKLFLRDDNVKLFPHNATNSYKNSSKDQSEHQFRTSSFIVLFLLICIPESLDDTPVSTRLIISRDGN